MAIPLRSALGSGALVHHGLLRASPNITSLENVLILCHNFDQIIMFSDLECDYINPIDLCNKLNQVRVLQNNTGVRVLIIVRPVSCPQFVLPEIGAHAFLTVLFLFTGQWIAFLLNAPLLAMNVNK